MAATTHRGPRATQLRIVSTAFRLFCDMAIPTRAVGSSSLLDLKPQDVGQRLTDWVTAQGLPPYRTRQLLPRLWQRPIGAWTDATELPLTLRSALQETLPLPRLELVTEQHSSDGTRKFLWRLDDGAAIESVLIPSQSRRTLCLSSQAGCALGCVFCATGRMGFGRNLTPFEIAGQAREIILRHPDLTPTNVVYMGMGEPLLNWPGVDASLTILNHPEGLGIGARHITVSTVGIIPGMQELAKRPEQFRLAISLHAATPERRLALMPVEKKYDLSQVLQAAKAFRKRITFEYVLISEERQRPRRRPAGSPGATDGRPGQPASAPPRRCTRPHPDPTRSDSGFRRTTEESGSRSGRPPESGAGYQCGVRAVEGRGRGKGREP